MRWQGRRESDNVEDRRGESPAPTGGGSGFRIPAGKGGIVLLIVVVVAGYYGYDLTPLLGGGGQSSAVSQSHAPSTQSADAIGRASGRGGR